MPSPLRRLPLLRMRFLLRITFATAFLLCLWSCLGARAGVVFYDSYADVPNGFNIGSMRPAVSAGIDVYHVTGPTGLRATGVGSLGVADVGALSSTTGLVQYGPHLAGERWERFDFVDGATSNIVIMPQTPDNAAAYTAGMPGIWPRGVGPHLWSGANLGFGSGAGGTVSRDSVDLAGAYPAWNQDKPFHMEVHWKVSGAATADLEMRVWNGAAAPDFAASTRVTFTLSSGSWTAGGRAAVTGTNTPGYGEVTAMAEYDAPTSYPTYTPATNPAISYSGVWAPMNGTEQHTAHPGGQFRFIAYGDACSLKILGGDWRSSPAISYRVDDAPWSRVTLSERVNVVTLFDGANWGPHQVDVFVSALYGADAFTLTLSRFMLQNVGLAPGGYLEANPYPAHKVLFLGDSLLNGFGVYDTPPNNGQLPTDNFEARFAVPALLADRLGVDVINGSIVGLGFIQQGDTTVGYPALPVLQNALYGVPWNPAWQPDAIIINMGPRDNVTNATNDQIQSAVRDYLAAVRAKFPSSRLLMLGVPYADHLAAMQAAFNAVADPNSQWVDSSTWLDSYPHRDFSIAGGHPTYGGNVKLAQRIAALIRDFVNTAQPSAAITIPATGAVVHDAVSIEGWAQGPSYNGYTLDFGSGDAPSQWFPIVQNPAKVTDGLLGLWNTYRLAPGPYTLRLRVTAAGNTTTATERVSVLKLGDVDGSGAVTLRDAAMALQMAAGIKSVSPAVLAAGDLQPSPGADNRAMGEGRITIADAVAIAYRAIFSSSQ